MATKVNRGRKKAKVKKPRKARRAQKLTYSPLSPVRAFLALVVKAVQTAPNVFQYSDGIGRYTLALSEAEAALGCWVGTKSIYQHLLPLLLMKPEHLARIEALKTRAASASTTVAISAPNAAKRKKRGQPSPDGKAKPLKVENETTGDRAANANFRDSARAQVHVRSRKPSDDVTLGRTPGHVGDLK